MIWLLVAAVILSPAFALNKCCPHGSRLNSSSVSCISEVTPFKERQSSIDTKKLPLQKFGFPNCTQHPAVVLNRTEFKLESEVGSVILRVTQSSARFEEDAFCIDVGVFGEHLVVVCPCAGNKCVRKCCHPGRVVNATSGECVWKPQDSQLAIKRIDDFYRLSDPEGECEAGKVIPGQVNTSSLIIDTRIIQIPGLKAEKFCVDETVDKLPVVLRCQSFRDPFMNNDQYYTAERKIALDKIFVPLVITGVVALALTVSLTLWFPELRKNLHQRMVFAHNLTLMFHDTCMAVRWLGRPWAYKPCLTIAFFHQYSLLSAFFWLNAICIDIALVFSGFHQVTVVGVEWCAKRFACLALYAMGAPFLIMSAMMIIEVTPSVTIFKPVFNTECIVQNQVLAWLSFLGPIGLLLLANLVLYIFTSLKIYEVSRAAVLSSADSRAHARNKENFTVLSKLFFIMFSTEGISWLVFFVGAFFELGEIVWLVHQVLHLIAGLLIFIVFCCTRANFRLVGDKLMGKVRELTTSSQEKNSSCSVEKQNRSF